MSFIVTALGASVRSASVEEDDEYDAEARAKRAEREAAAVSAASTATSGEPTSTKYGAIQKQSSSTSRSSR